jgi:hypothetical protein
MLISLFARSEFFPGGTLTGIDIDRENVCRRVVRLKICKRAARSVGLLHQVIRILLLDDIVAALEICRGGAAPPRLILVLPNAEGGVAFEFVDQSAEPCLCRKVSRRES